MVPINSLDTGTCILPKKNICEYISTQCTSDNFELAKFYYCNSNVDDSTIWANKWVIISCLILALLILFVTIATISSRYLSETLQYISIYCGIDQKLAGLTLLSLGNGSTDLISTYQAMSHGSTTLAIGELVGSSFFLVSFVIGAMGLIKPFKLNKVEFLTDVAFFVALIAISFWFIQDGELQIWECVMMCALYLAYLIFLIVYGSSADQEAAEDLLALDLSKPIIVMTPHALVKLTSPKLSLEYLVKLQTYLHANDIDLFNLQDSVRSFNNNDEEQALLANVDIGDCIRYAIPNRNDHSSPKQNNNSTTTFTAFAKQFVSLAHDPHSKVYTLYQYFIAPIDFILKVTIPMVPLTPKKVRFLQIDDRDEIQAMGSLIREFQSSYDSYHRHTKHRLSLFAYCQVLLLPFLFNRIFNFTWQICALGSVGLFLINLIISHIIPVSFQLLIVSAVGFLVLLNYITMITSVIIVILKNAGLILKINESLLGLTILSLGNSIGDLISNVTLTKLGLHITGLNACFGASLLYTLLGVGINGLAIMAKTGQTKLLFEVSRTLQISSLGLFLVLVFYVIAVSKNGWVMGKHIGFVALCWWLMINLINVALAIKGDY